MKMKKTLALILALVLTLSLCACGSSSAGSAAPQKNGYAVAAEPMAAPAMAAESASYDMDMSEELEVGGLAAAGAGADGGAPASADVNTEKIIYSADVTLETTAFDDTISAINDLMAQVGGWIESSSVNDANYYSRARGYASSRSAYYTLRVPSNRFSALMSGLSDLGNVPYTHTYTENVTAQYYDIQARLTAYTTQEARLLEMMEAAETVSDVIAIEEKLTELRYQIERLQSTLNNYDRRVSNSSIYLSVDEVQEYTPETEQHVSFGRELLLALQRGLRNFINACGDLLLMLAASLPGLVVLAVIIALAVVLLKKRRARKAAKKAARQTAPAPTPAPQEDKQS